MKATRRGQGRRGGFALVLGGGGARGLAHIGVLKALEWKGLVPELIVGTSMGAIVGGMYAQTGSARLVELMMKELLHSREFREVGIGSLARQKKTAGRPTMATMYRKMKRGYVLLRSGWSTGMVEDSILLRSLTRLLEDGNVQDCVIPFAAVACDLMAGREVVLRRGSILKAVAASAAIPGIVTPVRVNGRMLVDGGVTSLVPVEACRSLTDLPVVAVSVMRSLRDLELLRNVIDVVLRSKMISELALTGYALRDADVVIRPNVSSYGWADFAPLKALIRQGEKAGARAVPEILRTVRR
jgi:NTE family protein